MLFSQKLKLTTEKQYIITDGMFFTATEKMNAPSTVCK